MTPSSAAALLRSQAAALDAQAACMRAAADALEAAGEAPAAALQEERSLAARLGVELRTLRAARRRGELAARRVGRRVLLDVAGVEAWLAAQPSAREQSGTAPGDELDRALASGRVVRLRGAR